MIYRGYDIDETPFSDGVTIYFNKEYSTSAESVEEAIDLIDEVILTKKLNKSEERANA